MRKKLQTEKSIAQCLIERAPEIGYHVRWISPSDAIAQEDADPPFPKAEEILLEDADPPFPNADDLAMKLLDELGLIGSPVPEENKIFSYIVYDIIQKKQRYTVHIDIRRKDEKTASVRQVWYPVRGQKGSFRKIFAGIILVLMFAATLFFSFIVPYMPIIANKEDISSVKKTDQPETVSVQKEEKPKIDPELDRLQKEKDAYQNRLKIIAEEIKTLSSFSTYPLYSPKLKDLEQTCSLEEKLRDFFSQKEVLNDLNDPEILPWIMIEWRGKGPVPDIDRILLTNQDGKALAQFLERMNQQSRLEKSSE
ncbi:MAG: hypothetical protein Q4G69_08715 [Planctomycetia bacterium]|nr:hypothetical protein [Planctomycetia bacterium]